MRDEYQINVCKTYYWKLRRFRRLKLILPMTAETRPYFDAVLRTDTPIWVVCEEIKKKCMVFVRGIREEDVPTEIYGKHRACFVVLEQKGRYMHRADEGY